MSVRLQIHGDLKDLLNGIADPGVNCRDLDRSAPVKDLIESQGVPHTEVGLIVSRGAERSFLYTPAGGEIVDVFPHTPPVDVSLPSVLFPVPFGEASFVVDVNVARLAGLLRLTGFDCLYDPRLDDAMIAEVAGGERRILLTRDRELLKRNRVLRGRLIRSDRPWEQLAEVIRFFGLRDRIDLFCRCPRCNVPLVNIDKGDVLDQLEPLTRMMYDRFTRCPGCGQVYWSGSHHSRIREKLAAALDDLQ
ncbi:MAG: Mut7-C RNAse domain-containing protein [Thermovirgaceae bacterium]|nr:Mut7-C RNAse domain-containing protein [Synergistales bacterium]MDI9392225.1 Mut7-C RNAse domain-containing protein [Synergistota bacterium]HRW87786.1 Mut7-C RNAse domain-containing protein [Thermovirgaceae bacterium]MDD3830761.1 Mut7-C RNAse domain-containing protein [Synergistales bacterium]MDD5515076.1 Mut7-C RNAse domain-containing protein [Synergistales bacterium]